MVFHQINRRLPRPITFSQISLSIIPPGVRIHGIDSLPVAPGSRISFRSARVTIPLTSLFSSSRRINLQVDAPRIVLTPLPKKDGARQAAMPFKLNRVTITGGDFEFSKGRYRIELLNMDLKSYKVEDRIFYNLKSPHMKIIFPFSKELVRIEGDMSATVSQQGKRIQVQRLNWNTADFQITGNGRTLESGGFHFNIGFRGSTFNVLEPLLGALSTQGMAYANAVVAGDPDGRVSVNGRFRFPEMRINGEAFQAVRGNASWNSRSNRIQVKLALNDRGNPGQLDVTSRSGLTLLQLADLAGDKLAKVIDIYDDVPLDGRVSNGTIRIRGRRIQGEVSIEPWPKPRPGFNIGGTLDFTYNTRLKQASFHSSELRARFGILALRGETDGRRKGVRLRTQGEIKDFSQVNKYTKFFANVDLEPWKLQGGRGRFDLDLTKRGSRLDFVSHLDVKGTRANGAAISRLDGTINGQGRSVRGRFVFTDPELRGSAEFLKDDDHLEITFPEVHGSMAGIFQILDLETGLAGNGSGTCVYYLDNRSKQPRIRGRFAAPQLNFYDFPFEDVSGRFETNTKRLELSDLKYRFMQGDGNAALTLDYDRREYEVKGECENIRLQSMVKMLGGRGKVEFSGAGVFNQDPITARFSVDEIHLYPDRKGRLEGAARIFTDFSGFTLKAEGEIARGDTLSPAGLELSLRGDQFKGEFNLRLHDLNLVIPWKFNRGTLDITGQISSASSAKTDIRGIVRFNGAVLSIPNFSHALENFQGFLTFDNGSFSLKSFRATMGGGPVEGNGVISWDQGELRDFFFSLSGRDMTLYPIDRTVFTMDADLNLKRRDRKILVQGNLNFRDAVWEREVDEGIAFYTDPEVDSSGSGVMKLLEYDLKLNGRENIRMRNSFGDITGTFNLHLTGSSDFPRLAGTMESRKGSIFFSDHKFNLVKGRVTFNNRFVIDPMINMESETFIKNYRIRFNVKGISSRLQPEFQSSPPLARQDILALLSLGELFKRPTSTEMSSQIGTTGLITNQLTEEIQKRARKFGIDLVMKIDPVIAGTSREGTSRLTVGTSIARNLLIIYSTNISSLRQEIYYLQYQLSPSISLIGMHNQDGNFSLDIRYRRRRY